jgi:hypothetical protein
MIAQFGYFLADLIFPVTTVLRQIASAVYIIDSGGRFGGRRGGYYYDTGIP